MYKSMPVENIDRLWISIEVGNKKIVTTDFQKKILYPFHSTLRPFEK